jgi:hypothetical protein
MDGDFKSEMQATNQSKNVVQNLQKKAYLAIEHSSVVSLLGRFGILPMTPPSLYAHLMSP